MVLTAPGGECEKDVATIRRYHEGTERQGFAAVHLVQVDDAPPRPLQGVGDFHNREVLVFRRALAKPATVVMLGHVEVQSRIVGYEGLDACPRRLARQPLLSELVLF